LTQGRPSGYTFGMKIAVSIPDDVFAEAESLAQRLNTSRSELYSRALTEFVGHHAPERVTELMNHVVSQIGAGEPDAFRAEAARRVFKRTEW
jgi:predicted transcriptional regulator